MALLTASALGKTIRENDIDSLYYFYGHDTAALESFTKRLVNKLCPADAQVMNFHKLDGKNLDFPMLTDACEALPFMAERVVVTINDLNIDAVTKDDLDDLKKILGSLGENTTVIIYATGVDLFKNKKYLTDKNKRFADFCEKHGTVCNFEYKRASDLGKSISTYLAKSGCTITKSNAEYLANLCLCDTAFISKELEKLSAYAEGREVTREDIDLLCIRRIESDGYSLAINILRGNAAMVFTRLRELDVQNYEPYAIIGIIGFSLADIYRAKLARSSGRSGADVAKDFSYAKNREFAVKNAYSECGNISAERIRKTLEILSETDLMLKTRSRGKDGDMLTLEQGLARSMALRC
ncbi:DNA polymerase III subunit delta [uncultured Ruminococcus sp.]|uniref:DNA polymerase III subunit delta n=1 Tax=uncultured Ruminococcus sp. TaxID=165186 RepID=UPI002593FC2B|nr:DNA polymerase III subunit delta [uncultured Ruminococcus sp.]